MATPLSNQTSLMINKVYEPLGGSVGHIEQFPDFQQHPVVAHNL